MRYFYTVAQFQHMTRAAEHINIAQPALTQAIKSLERELGVELFAKKGRNIVLTEYGEFLQKRLETILPEIDGLAGEIEQMKSRVQSTVKLNILAASTFVVNEIVEYRREHVEAVFDFEQSTRVGDCDIVIKTNGIEDTSRHEYISRHVKEEKIYLAVPRQSVYAQLEAIDLDAVRDEGFVMLSSSRQFGIICNKFCAAAGFIPKTLFESDSPSAVQKIISTGTGVAFWPEYSWGKAEDENVVLLPIAHPICRRELIIELHARANQSSHAEGFYRHLIREI